MLPSWPRLIAALPTLLLGCASESTSWGPLDVQLRSEQCSLRRGCEQRFELFLVRGQCVYAWAAKQGGGSADLALAPLDLAEGKLQVLASCSSERCVQCWAAASFGAEPRLDLQLATADRCDVPQAVTAPCPECGPAQGAYCRGDQRVTCVDGRPQTEDCPLGCVAGACKTCPKQKYWRDADGDGYGDASLPFEDCSKPDGYVENPDDCDDGDKRAKPGQTEFFTDQTLGKKSWDFDCSFSVERQLTEKVHCYVDPATKTCMGHGWKDEASPECGAARTFVTCQTMFKELIPFCVGIWSTHTQGCR
jgi:hypothetical protein